MMEKPTSELEFFRIIEVRTLDTLMKFWPFLVEGLRSLNKIAVAPVDNETLLRIALDIINEPELGKLVIVVDSQSVPLSYSLAFDNTAAYAKKKTMLVYAIYSNGKRKKASRYGLQVIEKWARVAGYTEMHGYSPRITGSAARLFETIFGYRKHSMFLTKSL